MPPKSISPVSPLPDFEVLLKKAIDKKASDLHLKAGLPPIVRVNGQLYYLVEESAENASRLSAETLSEWGRALMNTRQRERFESGEEVDLGYECQDGIRFRLNICQQRGKTRIVCRHISNEIRSLAELKLPKVIEEFSSLPRGLLLVTGTTGSGKSTTLAAIIDHIAKTRSCHIVTIEDPIEFSFKDRKSVITQREVGMDTESFARALKYALRQDPDVILVGEMRDPETILMALAAAETGHLVLSTLHTADTVESINRILGAVEPGMQEQVRHQLASTLVGVVCQRLVRTKDGKGRTPATEIMVCNLRVKEMILDPIRTKDIAIAIEESRDIGMQSFDQSLMDLYQQGLITKEEALSHCSHIQDFQLKLGGIVAGDWVAQKEGRARTKAEKIAAAQKSENEKIEFETVPGKKVS